MTDVSAFRDVLVVRGAALPGVVFPLFTIGLECSLAGLRRIGRLAAGGTLQVGLAAGRGRGPDAV